MSPEPGRCWTCRYHDRERYRCRFNAPAVVVVSGMPETVWPAASADDWCGEWTALRTMDQRAARPTAEVI